MVSDPIEHQGFYFKFLSLRCEPRGELYWFLAALSPGRHQLLSISISIIIISSSISTSTSISISISFREPRRELCWFLAVLSPGGKIFSGWIALQLNQSTKKQKTKLEIQVCPPWIKCVKDELQCMQLDAMHHAENFLDNHFFCRPICLHSAGDLWMKYLFHFCTMYLGLILPLEDYNAIQHHVFEYFLDNHYLSRPICMRPVVSFRNESFH